MDDDVCASSLQDAYELELYEEMKKRGLDKLYPATWAEKDIWGHPAASSSSSST